MFQYTVHIAVDPPNMFPTQPGLPSAGNFVYTPALLRVEPGDTITWISKHHFTLSFREGSPIEEMEIFGHQSGGDFRAGPFTVLTEKGQFHYTVAVWNGSAIFMDAGCPRISVN